MGQQKTQSIFKQLYKPSTMDGFGFPNLWLCFHVAQLFNALLYFCSSSSKGWLNIEQQPIAPRVLQETFWNTPEDRPPLSYLFLSLTLCTWDTHKFLLLDLSIFTSVLGQPWFFLVNEPCFFSIWHKANIYCFCDALISNKLTTKHDLEYQHNIQLPWYLFKQLSHLLQPCPLSNTSPSDSAPLEKFLELVTLTTKHLISRIYFIFSLPKMSALSCFQTKWSNDVFGQQLPNYRF